jgi:hypothetical protein
MKTKILKGEKRTQEILLEDRVPPKGVVATKWHMAVLL